MRFVNSLTAAFRFSKSDSSISILVYDILKIRSQELLPVIRKAVTAIGVILGAVGSLEKAIEWPVRMLMFFGNTLQDVANKIYSILKPGIELYKLQQGAMFSFAASFMSNAKVNGQSFSELPDGKGLALGLSKKLIERATLDAEMSAFSLEEILRSLQGTMPLLLNLGMSAEQAYEVNKGVAGVAKMIQLTPSQILQETRDLAQGSITSRGSQVANALGITNEDLNAFGSDVESRFEFLMGKFKNFSELLSDYEDTFEGRWQQLQERWQKTAETMVEDIAPLFKGLFEELILLTGRYEDANGNYLDAITGEWKKANGEIIGTREEIAKGGGYSAFGIGDPSFELSPELEAFKDALIDIIEYIAKGLDTFVAWVNDFTDGIGVVSIFKTVMVALINIISYIVDYFKKTAPIFAVIFLALNAFVNAIMTVVGAITTIIGLIITGVLGIRKLRNIS